MSRYEIDHSDDDDEMFSVIDNEEDMTMAPKEAVKILNTYDALLKRQAECGKTSGHIGDGVSFKHCFKCGADLTKGEKT